MATADTRTLTPAPQTSRSRTLSLALAAAALLVTLGLARQAAAAPVGVTVVIENLAPENGTWLTPTWVGFHAGTFDVYDEGAAAGEALERLAEDGNTGPLMTVFDGGDQATIPADAGDPPIAPGGTATMTFVLDSGSLQDRYLDWAAMVIPSNDAFIGNDDPLAHRVFDNGGDFLGAYVTVTGDEVLDAGTEVNDEIPAHTAFFGQTEPDSGDPENGVVHAHPGYLPPGSGGILDDPMFAAADFTQPGYEVARVTLYRSDTIVSGGDVSGTWTADGSPYIVQGDITVPASETLTVEPGVVVYTEVGHAITVLGNLNAVGTADAPILFTGPPRSDADVPGWKGIDIEGSILTSHFEYCTIEYGDASSDYESGGALHGSSASVELRHCTLRDNTAFTNGAAIAWEGGSLLVEDCEIAGNLIDSSNSGAGGGIYCENGTVEITGSRITDNRVETFTFFGATNSLGGGVALVDASGLIAKCVIAGNYLNHSGTEAESSGGGIYVDGNDVTVRGNTIYDNEVHYNNSHGGGVFFNGYDLQLIDNIVAGNFGEGAWFGPGGNYVVSHNDFHANSDGPAAGGFVPAGLGTITQTNANGDPCDDYFDIFLDPQLVAPQSGDFQLQSISPCIDAGDPASPPDPDGTVADIGAMYFRQETTGIPAGEDGTTVSLLMGSRPEPMTGAVTRIVFRNPQAGPVRLTVYDLRGRAVRELVDGSRPRGVQQVDFDGRDDAGRTLASGVYFYHLQAAGRDEAGKVTILR